MSAAATSAHLVDMTTKNQFNDHPERFLLALFDETGMNLSPEDARVLARKAYKVLDANEEVARLREINASMCKSHNALLVSISRAQDDVADYAERLWDAQEAASKPGAPLNLLRLAQSKADDLDDGDEIVALLTAALVLLETEHTGA